MEQPPLELDPLRQRQLEGRIDHLLGGDGGKRRHGGDLGGGLHRLLDQAFGRNHPRHQPGAFGLFGPHHPAGQAHFHRLGLADCMR